MHLAPRALLAEFEAYASENGAAYDIEECFAALALDHEERERDRLLNPHGG